jgi:hypothetical protein
MKRLWIAGCAALSLAACGGSGGSGDGMGTLKLGVTDAPVDDAEAVVITFTAVELLDGSDNPVQRFDLDEPQSIDLLTLQGSNSAFLVDGEAVPVGVYEQVRLIIDGPAGAACQQAIADPEYPNFITVDGVDYPLIVPSGAQTGLKVQGPITVAAGGSASYTVDFDLRKSIAERGVTGCYNLRPVLRVVDNAEVGTLAGTVDGDLLMAEGCTADVMDGSGAAVYVYNGVDAVPGDAGSETPPLTTSLLTPIIDENDAPTGDFSYEVGFLLAGDYTAAFTCQAGDDDPEADDMLVFDPVANVSITADQTTTQDFTLAAEPAP